MQANPLQPLGCRPVRERGEQWREMKNEGGGWEAKNGFFFS